MSCMCSCMAGGLLFVPRTAMSACVSGLAFPVRVCLRWFPAVVSECIPNHHVSLQHNGCPLHVGSSYSSYMLEAPTVQQFWNLIRHSPSQSSSSGVHSDYRTVDNLQEWWYTYVTHQQQARKMLAYYPTFQHHLHEISLPWTLSRATVIANSVQAVL